MSGESGNHLHLLFVLLLHLLLPLPSMPSASIYTSIDIYMLIPICIFTYLSLFFCLLKTSSCAPSLPPPPHPKENKGYLPISLTFSILLAFPKPKQKCASVPVRKQQRKEESLFTYLPISIFGPPKGKQVSKGAQQKKNMFIYLPIYLPIYYPSLYFFLTSQSLSKQQKGMRKKTYVYTYLSLFFGLPKAK